MIVLKMKLSRWTLIINAFGNWRYVGESNSESKSLFRVNEVTAMNMKRACASVLELMKTLFVPLRTSKKHQMWIFLRHFDTLYFRQFEMASSQINQCRTHAFQLLVKFSVQFLFSAVIVRGKLCKMRLSTSMRFFRGLSLSFVSRNSKLFKR